MSRNLDMCGNVIVVLFLVCLVFPLAGEKGEPFVPGTLPDGFQFSGSPQFYGTDKEARENGTIYDFMNGGGVVYLELGFQELTHILLKDKQENTITLNIFDMGTPANAAKALANETICPSGFKEIKIDTADAPGTTGATAKRYHYEPDFYLYFIKGKYLVYLAVNNDKFSAPITRFAKEIYKNIKLQ